MSTEELILSDSHRAAITYSPSFLQYDFGPHHPLRPERNEAGLDLLDEAGLWDRSRELLDPDPATDVELELVHEPEYIEAVRAAGQGRTIHGFGIGRGDNPPFPKMHEASAAVAGGTVAAVRGVLGGKLDHAFNAAGGLHHALPAKASGFCVYDDPALAAALAWKEFGSRTLYLDFDCHHGDGVQWIFYDRPEVMTVSFHESGDYLFPGTGYLDETGAGDGKGFSLNLPFAPFTGNDSWLEAVRTVVPEVAERFLPDLIISAHGADTHVWDPLTHLALTTKAFVAQARLVHALAHRYCQGRWIAVGSGGYDWRRVVPRSWAIVWCEMTGRHIPERLPDSWRQRWEAPGDMPARMVDLDDVSPPSRQATQAARENERMLEQALTQGKLIPQQRT